LAILISNGKYGIPFKDLEENIKMKWYVFLTLPFIHLYLS